MALPSADRASWARGWGLVVRTIIETVDSICSGVAEQFHSVASLEKHLALLQGADSAEKREALAAERRELLCQVIEAYKVLKSTRQDLAGIIDPGATLAAPEPAAELGTIIDQLRQEAEIARNTRERLRRDRVTAQTE